jgi:hypothetical protein
MNNETQQTAVEWQHIELMRINFEYATNKITPREFQEQTKYILDQAKEIEEEQHRQTWFDSTSQFDNSTEMTFKKDFFKKDFDRYYNETYGGNK